MDADETRPSRYVKAALAATREHRPTSGMRVTMGQTCVCDYWTGSEPQGPIPSGHNSLINHVAEAIARAVIAVADEEQTTLRAEIERLRVRIHEVVDEQQRRFAPYVSRCDHFDMTAKWATEYMPVDWSHESEAVRTVFMAERERAETAEAELADIRRRLADVPEA